jgi:hypothetical protein
MNADTFGRTMKANKILIVVAAALLLMFAVVLWADELTNRVGFVSKQLGCEFPYLVAENSETGWFYAEAKLKDPQRLNTKGFPDAESGYVVSIQTSLPGEYRVKAVPDHRMLAAADEMLFVIEYTSAIQNPADEIASGQNPADAIASGQNPADAIASGITIKGVITNFVDVKNYFSPASYVQLVEITPKIKAKEIVVNGFMNLKSNLPKMPVLPDGSFTLKTNSIKPGRYWLYLQNVKLAVTTNPTVDAILAKGGNHFQIVISENVKSLIFDCGNLSVIRL